MNDVPIERIQAFIVSHAKVGVGIQIGPGVEFVWVKKNSILE